MNVSDNIRWGKWYYGIIVLFFFWNLCLLNAIRSRESAFQSLKEEKFRNRVFNTILGYPVSIVYGIKQKCLIFLVSVALILLGAISKE